MDNFRDMKSEMNEKQKERNERERKKINSKELCHTINYKSVLFLLTMCTLKHIREYATDVINY